MVPERPERRRHRHSGHFFTKLGFPALVLLSKSDLLAEGDLHRSISYIREHIKRDLGLDVDIHAVSALNQYSVMLDHFYERELLPRFEQARSLKEAS